MAPMPSNLLSSGSRKKEPGYACLSEAKDSHSHRMWTEVYSSVNTCVTWQGIDYKLPDDDTIVSKHVGFLEFVK
jgi:hypothetical protein